MQSFYLPAPTTIVLKKLHHLGNGYRALLHGRSGFFQQEVLIFHGQTSIRSSNVLQDLIQVINLDNVSLVVRTLNRLDDVLFETRGSFIRKTAVDRETRDRWLVPVRNSLQHFLTALKPFYSLFLAVRLKDATNPFYRLTVGKGTSRRRTHCDAGNQSTGCSLHNHCKKL